MKYVRSMKYSTSTYISRIMGPNPIKLAEELLAGAHIAPGDTVMDLGSGNGVTSAFIAKEFGARVFAADLWSDPSEIQRFFAAVGLTREQTVPIHADASALPFAHEFFDAVVSVDSYHYFGREPGFLAEKLLPFVKRGGYIYIAVPGMKRDRHSALPPELLLSWTPEDMETMHDVDFWRESVSGTADAEMISVHEMESMDEVWADWLALDNKYAVGDRKAMFGGGGKYLNFIAMVLRRK